MGIILYIGVSNFKDCSKVLVTFKGFGECIAAEDCRVMSYLDIHHSQTFREWSSTGWRKKCGEQSQESEPQL